MPERFSDIENAGGDVEKAAVAEQRVIDAVRELGNDVLQGWAHRQHEKKEAVWTATPGINRKGKKCPCLGETPTHAMKVVASVARAARAMVDVYWCHEPGKKWT